MEDKRHRLPAKDFLRWFPLYSLILAIFPIASLLATNISQIYTLDALKPILIALLSALVILAALWALSRDWQLAGLLTSLLAVWFFTYGHLYNQLKNAAIFGLMVGRHRYLLLIWSAIFLIAAIWLVVKFRTLPNVTLAINIICAILICLPIIQIGAFHLRTLFSSPTPAATTNNALISWKGASSPPDIYYIVLDGYGRSDALAEVEGIDNTSFLNALQGLGFYVAKCSQSNYTRTLLSLASTFNMEYVQTLDPQVSPGQDPSWLLPYLKHNIVRQQLEGLGYKTIVFQNPWEAMIWDDAAIVYRSHGAGLLSPFEYLLLSTTVVRVYLDAQQAENTQIAYYSNYEDTLYTLEQLQNVPNIPGPKFVFAHIVVPHSPFVFGPDGEFIDIRPYDTVNNLYTAEDHRRGYTAAVTYIDKQMLEILPKLIRGSKTQPIIILAGDHGTGGSDTVTQNLEAFYFAGAQADFYDNITPVNIFRSVFDAAFNGSFDLLPDKSYFSAGGKYFNFQEIPNHCTVP